MRAKMRTGVNSVRRGQTHPRPLRCSRTDFVWRQTRIGHDDNTATCHYLHASRGSPAELNRNTRVSVTILPDWRFQRIRVEPGSPAVFVAIGNKPGSSSAAPLVGRFTDETRRSSSSTAYTAHAERSRGPQLPHGPQRRSKSRASTVSRAGDYPAG